MNNAADSNLGSSNTGDQGNISKNNDANTRQEVEAIGDGRQGDISKENEVNKSQGANNKDNAGKPDTSRENIAKDCQTSDNSGDIQGNSKKDLPSDDLSDNSDTPTEILSVVNIVTDINKGAYTSVMKQIYNNLLLKRKRRERVLTLEGGIERRRE